MQLRGDLNTSIAHPDGDMTRVLNRNSPVPLYAQLQTSLVERVHRGEWRAGEALPSESQLCGSYGVSRTVVRQALEGLERSGLIYRVKGRGAFIAERKVVARLLQDPTGFEAQMVAQGLAVRTVVLKQGVVPALGDVAQALQSEEGASVLRLERLRLVDGEPIFYGLTFVPCSPGSALPDADFERESFNAILGRMFGLVPSGGTRVIEAVAAGQREAELLQVRVGAPLFRLFAVTCAQDERPMECSLVWLRGDRTSFEVNLSRRLESNVKEVAS